MRGWLVTCVAVTAALVTSGSAQVMKVPGGYFEGAVQPSAETNQYMGAVRVTRGDNVLLNKGFGSASLQPLVANAPTTRFPIGSLTKQFTAAAILILEERGRIALTDGCRSICRICRTRGRVSPSSICLRTRQDCRIRPRVTVRVPRPLAASPRPRASDHSTLRRAQSSPTATPDTSCWVWSSRSSVARRYSGLYPRPLPDHRIGRPAIDRGLQSWSKERLPRTHRSSLRRTAPAQRGRRG